MKDRNPSDRGDTASAEHVVAARSDDRAKAPLAPPVTQAVRGQEECQKPHPAAFAVFND